MKTFNKVKDYLLSLGIGLVFYWFMVTLITMGGSDSMKRLDACSFRHTHWNTHLVGRA